MRCSTEPQEKAAYAAVADTPDFYAFSFFKALEKSGFFGTGIKGGIQMVNPVRNHRFYMRKQRNETKEGGWFLSTKKQLQGCGTSCGRN